MIPDDAQLPEGVWADLVRDVRSGMTDTLILASRHGISEARAERAVQTLAPVPKSAGKKAWKGRRQF